jgi:hypothetical protein
MRGKLLKLYQKIDLLSNSIMIHGTKQSESQISIEQQRLQKNIRVHAINYLKEYSFKLTQLPSAEEYEKLKEHKRKLLVEDLERERRQQRPDDSSTSSTAGWIPTAPISVNNEGKNPVEIQIDVVKKYLNEAKKEKRLEEVKILEDNLSELTALLHQK